MGLSGALLGGLPAASRAEGTGHDGVALEWHAPAGCPDAGAVLARVRELLASSARSDPAIRARIHAALGDARTVVNVGAGAGSYEPHDRHVIAIEPSGVMAAQRPRSLAPAIRAFADALPLADGAVDAAMAILSVHHWDEARAKGVRELRRVARGAVVILTYDPRVSGEMWLMRDYLPAAIARTPGLEPGLFGLVMILIVLFEPLGIYGRWLKVKAFFDTFPLYRRSTFKRQRSYLKTERVR